MPVLIPEAQSAVAVAGMAVALLSLLAGAIALARTRRLQSRYDALMNGVDGGDLSRMLEAHIGRVSAAETRAARLARQVDRFDAQLRHAVQRVQLVRYSAFDEGGDQSFSLAMMDAENNGAVLTGLLGRTGMRLYAKPLLGGRSPYALTAEEQQAVTGALATADSVDSAADPSV